MHSVKRKYFLSIFWEPVAKKIIWLVHYNSTYNRTTLPNLTNIVSRIVFKITVVSENRHSVYTLYLLYIYTLCQGMYESKNILRVVEINDIMVYPNSLALYFNIISFQPLIHFYLSKHLWLTFDNKTYLLLISIFIDRSYIMVVQQLFGKASTRHPQMWVIKESCFTCDWTGRVVCWRGFGQVGVHFVQVSLLKGTALHQIITSPLTQKKRFLQVC